MNEKAPVSPERIMQLTGGARATALVGAGAAHRVFTHLEGGADSAEALAAVAGISPRGAQALLDGLVGLGLVVVRDGRYANAEDASTFLVEGKPTSLTGLARVSIAGMARWAALPASAATGAPAGAESTATPDYAFWRELVPAIAPLAIPAVQATIARLRVAAAGPISILDVGGGSGIFSALMLGANREARSTQVDWPAVNRIARDFVAGFGVADRFHTVDGDFHVVDWGTAAHDIAVFSNIAHQETPAENMAAYRKFRAALKPGGTLVISDFVVDDDRSGPPFALMFHGEMLLGTHGGSTWRRADYRAWLSEAGFHDVSIEPTAGPSTLVYAR